MSLMTCVCAHMSTCCMLPFTQWVPEVGLVVPDTMGLGMQ